MSVIGMVHNICPKCNKILGDYPALSRRDNKTLICSDCGLNEALIDFCLSKNNTFPPTKVRGFHKKAR